MIGNKEEIIVGLDIGTSKILALVGLKKSGEPLEVIGMGTMPSQGIKKGVVVDLESATESVIRAVEAAEESADVEVGSVFVSVSGNHVKGFNSQGSVPITQEDKEITATDVERSIAAARAVSIPLERRILHVIPQDYAIDGEGGIRDPRGMSGVKLEVGVHIVTAAVTMIQNIQKCLDRGRLECEGYVLAPLASSEAVLTREEKDMGAVLVDYGGGVLDAAAYIGGSLKFTSCIGGGGNQISNDIAVGLRLPNSKAEEIKKRHASALRSSVGASEEFVLPGVLGRSSKNMASRDLATIIEARVEETFTFLKELLARAALQDKIGAGLVLTGGSAQLKHIDQLAARVFNIPVRLATPRSVTGMEQVLESSAAATAVGLLLLGQRIRDEKKISAPVKRRLWDVIRQTFARAVHKENHSN